MGMAIRATSEDVGVWMYCSVTDVAFGPRFDDADALDEFVEYCKHVEEIRDLRAVNDRMLQWLHGRWLAWRARRPRRCMADPEALQDMRDELEKSVLVERLQASIDVVEGRRPANEVSP